MRRSLLIGLIISTIIIGITAGIITHIYSDEEVAKATITNVKEINRTIENQIVIQTASTEEKTSPNAEITFETYYNRCAHSKIDKQQITSNAVSKTEEELEEIYPEWKIKKFSSDEIIMYREENKMCDDHFMIKENEGYVTIYSIDENNNQEILEKTEIATQYLPEEDIELLKKGIKVNSSTELKKVLSDYE